MKYHLVQQSSERGYLNYIYQQKGKTSFCWVCALNGKVRGLRIREALLLMFWLVRGILQKRKLS